MIRIEKSEFGAGFAPTIVSESRADIDFYDLTAFDLTKQDFNVVFKDQIGPFANISMVEDHGDHITYFYQSQNSGVLKVYPCPPQPPKKPDKRPTKNLESLVSYANSKGLNVSLYQSTDLTWNCFLHGPEIIVADTYNPCVYPFPATAYAAVKLALQRAGLLPC